MIARTNVFAMITLGVMSAWTLSALAVGGDDCPTATSVVAPLPYIDSGNTCGFNNLYDETCPDTSPGIASASSEVVYVYTPPTNECIHVRLCSGTVFDAKLYIYDGASGCPLPGGGDSPFDIACRDTGCPIPATDVPEVTGLMLTGGLTYWFVVDGRNDACGDYQLVIVPCGPASCTADPECEDGNPCTADACINQSCVNDPIMDCCTCDAQCDDQDPCTEDQCCDGTCQNLALPVGFQCDDQDVCTESDICEAGGGCAGVPVDCSDLNSDCSAGTCNAQTGACESAPVNEGGSCDDGLNCTDGETCTAGICGGGTPPDCDDFDPCTADSCEEDAEDTLFCVHAPIPGCCMEDADCDDGFFCNGEEVCDQLSLTCQAGSSPDCDDLNPCTIDVCDDDDGKCEHTAIEPCCVADQDCDDENECTADVCAVGNTCQNQPVTGAACGDQSATACSAPDTCDQSGVCQPNHINDGSPCDDDDACTDMDVCASGACNGVPNGFCETCAQLGPGTDPRNQISFQARLLDSNGDPVPGPVDITFQFYADEAGMNPVGAPILRIGSSGYDGLYSEQLPITETIFDGSARWLGVSVDNSPELTPLIPVNSSPQAFRVGCAAGEEISDHVRLGGVDTRGELRIAAHGAAAGARQDVEDYAVLSAESAEVGSGNCGQLVLNIDGASDPSTTVELKACSQESSNAAGGVLRLSNPDLIETVELRSGYEFSGGKLTLYNADRARNLQLASSGMFTGGITIKSWPDLEMSLKNDSSEKTVSIIESDTVAVGTSTFETGGGMRIYDNGGTQRIHLDGGSDSNGAAAPDATIRLYRRDEVQGVRLAGSGSLTLQDSSGITRTTLRPSFLRLRDGSINLTDSSYEKLVVIDSDHNGGGQILLNDSTGNTRLTLEGDHHWNGAHAGKIALFNDSGDRTVAIFGDHAGSGNGRVVTDVLELTGGCDLSEQFDVGGHATEVTPGLVVSIDPTSPGRLRVSSSAYDHTVAGVISGAGGVRPGVLMGQSGSIANGKYPVALTGRVYVLADTANGGIQPGDLMTTSNLPGHAMKVTDHTKALGAILGKAMTSLSEGQGLVLILVSLQ